MDFKLTFPKTTFSDFYGPGQTNIKEYTGPKYTETQTPTDQNVYVHDCVFQSCSSSSNGGALSCGSTVYKLLVEQTSFVSCWTSSIRGGAIHFESTTNGECILSKICGFNCSSTYTSGWAGGQCVITCTKNDATYKNYVNDTSFTHSLIEGKDSRYVMYLIYGHILCPSVNITDNKCTSYTATYCGPVTGSSMSDIFCMTYSSIVNNTSNGGHSCLWLDRSGSSQRIDTCNIINNKQTSSEQGTIYTYANLLIKDSCILGNNENNKVFYAYSSNKITISNCTIDDNIFTNGRYYGSVTVIKTITNTFINALSHISTHHCDSYFDSYGTLTAKPNVPSKKPRNLISCNCICPIIDALRFIQFLFLLTFLSSNPSNDAYFIINCPF
jgi:hypothetical protein